MEDMEVIMSGETGQTRDRMTRVALELFAENSYEGTSVQMIASTMGLSKAAVVYHFRTKESLLAAVTQGAFQDLDAFLTEMGALGSRRSRWQRSVTGYPELLVRHRLILGLICNDAGAANCPVVEPELRNLEERLHRLFIPEDAGDAQRVYVTAALSGLQSAASKFPGLPDDVLLRLLTDTASRMLVLNRVSSLGATPSAEPTGEPAGESAGEPGVERPVALPGR
jgi:AcrR family transcriptional regulator